MTRQPTVGAARCGILRKIQRREGRPMFFPFLLSSLTLAVCAFSWVATAQAPPRIFSDPDNLPFSDQNGDGFDQRIAVLIARDLQRKPIFVWARARRGFLREQFNKDACDLLLGVPSNMRSVSTTVPYYTSSYVFVSPRW